MATEEKSARKRGQKRPVKQSIPAKKKAAPLPRSERGKLKALLAKVEERLQSDASSKVSISDYIRLLQMKRELDQKKPRDVEVKWVDTLGEEENATEI
jgi:hypothetical protein